MDDIKLWFRERKAVYSTMSLLYRGNLKDGFDILKNTDLLEKLENSNLYPEARAILNEISKDNFNSKYTGELIEDYYRLFFGPSHILAPLWESTYESRDRLIFGRSELSVRMFYHEFDLEVNPKEAADNLAFELSFMSRLCDLGFRGDLKNVMKILGAEEKFLRDHLCSWVPTWESSVKHNAKTMFWIEFSSMTKTWVEENLRELEKMES